MTEQDAKKLKGALIKFSLRLGQAAGDLNYRIVSWDSIIEVIDVLTVDESRTDEEMIAYVDECWSGSKKLKSLSTDELKLYIYRGLKK